MSHSRRERTSARPRSGFHTLLAEFRCGLVARRSFALTQWRQAENNSYFANRKFEQACEFGLFLFGNVRQAINLIMARAGARGQKPMPSGVGAHRPLPTDHMVKNYGADTTLLSSRIRDPAG